MICSTHSAKEKLEVTTAAAAAGAAPTARHTASKATVVRAARTIGVAFRDGMIGIAEVS
jgi:hypothetical protein